MTFYQFASDSPWLTFFLALVIGDVVVKMYQATCIALAVRSDK